MPAPPSSADGSHRNEQSGSHILGLSGLLIELVLPVALAGALLLLLTAYTSRWDLRSPLGLAVFGVLLVALSLFVSLGLDTLTLDRRRRSGRRLLNRPGPRWRLAKSFLAGVVIPIAALCAATLFELPNHQTPMAFASLTVRSRLARPEANRAAQLGDAVLRARSPAARVQGILALQAMASPEAADQLLRVLVEDPTALNDASEYRALSAALASYGVLAKMRLLELFNGVPPAARRSAPAPPDDAFERGIADRQPGTAAQSMDPEHSTSQPEAKATGGMPSFVLQTFLQTGLTEDAELLAFARQTAADDGWSEAVRGQALQLIAKLGGKDDLDGLFAYLQSPSTHLQAHALRAIASLQSRLSATASK